MSNETNFKFFCVNCEYSTNRKSNIDKHNKTEKHKNGGKVKETFSQEEYECKTCKYKSADRSNFARHLKSEIHQACVDAYVFEYKQEFSKYLKEHFDVCKGIFEGNDKEILLKGFKQHQAHNHFAKDFIEDPFERFNWICLLKKYNSIIGKKLKSGSQTEVNLTTVFEMRKKMKGLMSKYADVYEPFFTDSPVDEYNLKTGLKTSPKDMNINTLREHVELITTFIFIADNIPSNVELLS